MENLARWIVKDYARSVVVFSIVLPFLASLVINFLVFPYLRGSITLLLALLNIAVWVLLPEKIEGWAYSILQSKSDKISQ